MPGPDKKPPNPFAWRRPRTYAEEQRAIKANGGHPLPWGYAPERHFHPLGLVLPEIHVGTQEQSFPSTSGYRPTTSYGPPSAPALGGSTGYYVGSSYSPSAFKRIFSLSWIGILIGEGLYYLGAPLWDTGTAIVVGIASVFIWCIVLFALVLLTRLSIALFKFTLKVVLPFALGCVCIYAVWWVIDRGSGKPASTPSSSAYTAAPVATAPSPAKKLHKTKKSDTTSTAQTWDGWKVYDAQKKAAAQH